MRAEGRSLAKPFLQALKTCDPFQRTATYLAGMSLCKQRGTEQLRLGRHLCRKAQGGKAPVGGRGGTQVGGEGWGGAQGTEKDQSKLERLMKDDSPLALLPPLRPLSTEDTLTHGLMLSSGQ